jgi:hypothetical protein
MSMVYLYANFIHSTLKSVASIRLAISKTWSVTKQFFCAKTFAFFITEKGSSARNALFRHFRFEDKKTLIDKIDETLIPGRHHYDSEYRNSPILKEKMQELKTEKFLESHNVGYRKFYFIAGGDSLQIYNEELEITGNVTAGKLKNAFGKYNKKRQVNRVLVSRFIQEIAV